MAHAPPNHRALRISETAQRGLAYDGAHPFETAFDQIIRNVDGPLLGVTLAWEWYQDDKLRHLLDAAIIGKATDGEIAQALDMDATVLQPYRHLFCDRQVFRHALEAMRYGMYEVPCEDLQRSYYRTAIEQGPRTLLLPFILGEKPTEDPKKIIQVIAGDQYHRFLSHRGLPIGSDDAREALRWGTAAVQTALAAINKGGSDQDELFKRIHIRLTTDNHTSTMLEAGITKEDIGG